MKKGRRKANSLTVHVAKGIQTLQRNYIREMFPVPLTAEQIFERLFAEEVRFTMRQAYKYSTQARWSSSYSEYPVLPDGNATLKFTQHGWEALASLAPTVSIAAPADEAIPELVDYVGSVAEVCAKFAELSAVASWLIDKTNGMTARVYCPWIASVLQDPETELGNGPVQNVPGIGPFLSTIREVNGLAAMALLANNKKDEPTAHCTLSISAGCILSRVDQMTKQGLIPAGVPPTSFMVEF
jgi:hypothetical protein